ncbi:MerR family transcriptional regulator [Hirschia baltica]|uniref:Transcriptional regulator, MerR family n=1 Tax=Hirschia baltica (strain ATCC 49814 / DSM 5838 / IFAM 1418) TaxID=582402 RepID=C6XQL6_HIRBI|nr:MerR family DNA-binding transcriptional regulator [Hirschia baltica]ACT58622.1 transcriptional regulator, MerR family [Hirschia baltica ATCC 49814]
MRSYSIGELAKEFEVTPRALRFYEDKDLLHPTRNGMHRVYSYKDRGRLQLILQGKNIGFSLAEIRELLDVYNLEGPRVQMERMLERYQDQVKKLEKQRRDIDGALVQIKEHMKAINDHLAKPSKEVLLQERDRIFKNAEAAE